MILQLFATLFATLFASNPLQIGPNFEAFIDQEAIRDINRDKTIPYRTKFEAFADEEINRDTIRDKPIPKDAPFWSIG